MSKIYILYKLERRAETTDTLLYYASTDIGVLQEIILSLWQEAREIIYEAMGRNPDMTDENKEHALELYIKQFGITSVPII